MAVSRPDGLPLDGENLDYNSNETTTFTGDAEDIHVAFASFQHVDRDIALDPLPPTGAWKQTYQCWEQ